MKKSRIPWPEGWLKKRDFRGILIYSIRDLAVTVFLYFATVLLCLALRQFDANNDSHYVSMLFLLDVFLTSSLTDVFLFSLLSAVIGVLSVDIIFTQPYWNISFTLAGFPVTFFVMMTICILTSIITSRSKRLDAANREAETEKTYANLLRAVSHDIRTPLTGIVGATSVLLEQEDSLTPQQRQELLKNTNSEAQWLIHIVENLLSITRLGAENARLHKTVEPIEEVLEGAVAKFAKRWPQIRIRTELPEELLMAPMDPILIQQVLTNLLENAAIHGKETTCVEVELRREGNEACIAVADDGKGISAEQLNRLFDGQTYRTEQGDGKRNMGIGLSTCQTVVQAHRGRIRAENRATGGAVFFIYLPMEETDDDQG